MKEIKNIPLGEIYGSDEFNCRGDINPTTVIDLAKSIESTGLIQPISVTEVTDEHRKIMQAEYTGLDQLDTSQYKYFLLAGYRRFTAHGVLKWPAIDAIVQPYMDIERQMIYNLNENLQREEIGIVQEARTLNKLLRRGLTETEIAEQTHTSRGWVQVRKMLLQLPPELQTEFEAGLLLQTHIRDLYTEFNNNGKDACIEHAKVIKDAKAKGLSAIPKPKSAKKANAKRLRKKGEMFEMMDHLRDSVGYGLHTRMLAWCCGEITDQEVYESVKEHAESLGLEYNMPELR